MEWSSGHSGWRTEYRALSVYGNCSGDLRTTQLEIITTHNATISLQHTSHLSLYYLILTDVLSVQIMPPARDWELLTALCPRHSFTRNAPDGQEVPSSKKSLMIPGSRSPPGARTRSSSRAGRHSTKSTSTEPRTKDLSLTWSWSPTETQSKCWSVSRRR